MSPKSKQEKEIILSNNHSVIVELNNDIWTLILFDETGALLDKFIHDTNCNLLTDQATGDGAKLPREKKILGDKHKFEEGDALLIRNLIWNILCPVTYVQNDSIKKV